MTEVHVLFDGFSQINENGREMYANCTCTLIKGQVNIIVDTMTAWDGHKIIKGLEKHDLKPENITWVVCTHGHSDHIGNNSLFQNATHVVGQCISKGEIYFIHDFNKSSYNINDKIKIVATPGHTLSDISVIVETGNKNLGTIAIVGDLFEKEQDIFNENIWIEAGSENRELQRQNRKKIVQIANLIIPGHGPMFKVTEEVKKVFL